MIILLPLADGEKPRINIKHSENKLISIHTSDCIEPFNHIFFAEIGKLLHFWKTNTEDFDEICFIQNRRFFQNFEDFPKDKNKVYLAKKEITPPNIKEHFKNCHPNANNLFNKILDKIPFNTTKLNIECFMSPHNIFISNKNFFNNYCEFLNEYLIPFFNKDIQEKQGALICERLLHLFAYSNFNVIEKGITVLPKNS